MDCVVWGWWRRWFQTSEPNIRSLTNPTLFHTSDPPAVCSSHDSNASLSSFSYSFRSLSSLLPLVRMIFAQAAPLPTPGDHPVHHGSSSFADGLHLAVAYVCLVWFIVAWLVCCIGYASMYTKYRKPKPSALPVAESDLPFVTILRPIKGTDPNLDLCLTSTCLLDYPLSKYELVFCVASPQDSAIPTIRNVMDAHPNVDTKLVIGEEDVGPNPKIRNLSKGYREAKGDITWILDCNVWVSPGTLSRSVSSLEGFSGQLGYKVVHHLPICVDTTPAEHECSSPTSPLSPISPVSPIDRPWNPLLGRSATPSHGSSFWSKLLCSGGGRLEESFLSSSHAKFYCAINTVAVAPCVVGKSSMFRRSHLAEATNQEGINYFAYNICEDHLIAEKLWMTTLREEKTRARKWRKHILGSDLVFQPTEFMSVKEYLARRTRWIRVRKYSTLAATLLEPATESLLCSFIGGYAFTTVPFLRDTFGSSWGTLWTFWAIAVSLWAIADRLLFCFLHQYKCVVADENTPRFVREKKGRSIGAWALQWLGREGFAPIVWLWAMWPGEVNWRGGRYRIRWNDLKVEEIAPTGKID